MRFQIYATVAHQCARKPFETREEIVYIQRKVGEPFGNHKEVSQTLAEYMERVCTYGGVYWSAWWNAQRVVGFSIRVLEGPGILSEENYCPSAARLNFPR